MMLFSENACVQEFEAPGSGRQIKTLFVEYRPYPPRGRMASGTNNDDNNNNNNSNNNNNNNNNMYYDNKYDC